MMRSGAYNRHCRRVCHLAGWASGPDHVLGAPEMARNSEAGGPWGCLLPAAGVTRPPLTQNAQKQLIGPSNRCSDEGAKPPRRVSMVRAKKHIQAFSICQESSRETSVDPEVGGKVIMDFRAGLRAAGLTH